MGVLWAHIGMFMGFVRALEGNIIPLSLLGVGVPGLECGVQGLGFGSWGS